MPESPAKENQNYIMKTLGNIEGQLEQLSKSNSRTTLALIGVIAAQIGVKVLGTPILLDIATVIGIIGIFILIGALTQGYKLLKRNCSITRTGVMLAVMMVCIGITQIMVYFRDLGYIDPNIIYATRIVQNVAILGFAWQFMLNHHITKDKPEKPGECK
jgi:hypothetical protein